VECDPNCLHPNGYRSLPASCDRQCSVEDPCIREERCGFDKFVHLAIGDTPGLVPEDSGRKCLTAEGSTPAGVPERPETFVFRLATREDLMCEPALVAMVNLGFVLRRAGLCPNRCTQSGCTGEGKKE
jgi:hypothetical protein